MLLYVTFIIFLVVKWLPCGNKHVLMLNCSDPLCPISQALSVIGGKWKPIIIYQLSKTSKRFGQLNAAIPGISRKVLTSQLKELTVDQLVTRHSFAESPPRVEYKLTDKAKELIPIFCALGAWGKYLVEEYKQSLEKDAQSISAL